MQTSRKSTAKSSGIHLAVPTPKNSAKSKRDQLIGLLRAKGGADIDQLTKALGWLPHTVRAALTGLRKSGLTIGRVEGVGGKPARYSIAFKPERAR